MAVSPKELEAQIQGLLAKIASIKAARPELTDGEIEAQAHLPQAWLAKTRAGKNRHRSAMVSLENVVRWATLNEVAAPARHSKQGPEQAAPPIAPVDGLGDEAFKIGIAIVEANTAEELDSVLKLLGMAVATGKIDRRDAKLLTDISGERRKTLELKRQEVALSALTTRARHLTPQEAEWIAERRASLVPPSLAPSEAAPPPGSP